MKKIVIGLIALSSLSALAEDARLGAGIIAKKTDLTVIQIVAGTKSACETMRDATVKNLEKGGKLVVSIEQCAYGEQYPFIAKIEIFKY